MVFGEIVEPSTRALIDDEYEEYPDYSKPEIEWEGTFDPSFPLTDLFFIEGTKMIKLVKALLSQNLQIQCSLKRGGVQIYKFDNERVVVFYEQRELTTGEIIEELGPWLKRAKIYAIASQPISGYQNLTLAQKPETLIRVLGTKKSQTFNYIKLESPNVVSGLGADVLAFAIHIGLESSVFVVYMDNSPLDSKNTNSVVALLRLLNLPANVALTNLNPISSNLYL